MRWGGNTKDRAACAVSAIFVESGGGGGGLVEVMWRVVKVAALARK